MTKECIQKSHKNDAMQHRLTGLKEGLQTMKKTHKHAETESKLKSTVFVMMRENQDWEKKWKLEH